MKLHEVAKQLDPHAKIKKWLDKHNIQNYTIRPDGVVDVDGDAILTRRAMSSIFTLPVQFGIVDGNFDCSESQLTSLKGCPYHVGRGFNCYGTKITSLEYAPQYIGSRFVCFETRITSLTGIDKIVKHIGGTVWYNEKSTHILGLLLIKGITRIDIDNGGPIDEIMNKYVGTGDILSAQDELIDAGFTDQARL